LNKQPDEELEEEDGEVKVNIDENTGF